jgi:hypothetical protein
MAFGQHVQSLAFDDLGLGGGGPNSGTYNSTNTFSFDVNLTFSGYNSLGLSFWLETVTAFAGSLQITNVTYPSPVFLDPNQTTPNPAPFNVSSGATAGNLTEARDLGTTTDPGPGAAPGTYTVAHVTFAITGAAPGTYVLRSTTVLPRASEVSDTNFMDNLMAASNYTITIVPEPSSFALLALGLGGAALILYRRKRAASMVS